MKKWIAGALLLTAAALFLPAQQQQQPPPMRLPGWACRYESDETGLYAAHMTYPFGTRLKIINTVNGKEVIVQIGSRPDLDTYKGQKPTIEISPEASDLLEMDDFFSFYPVVIEEIPKVITARAVRPRMGEFNQTGPAVLSGTILGGGQELSAAHPSLAMGTKIKVINTINNRVVTLTITGRIRASPYRVLEISQAAADVLRIGRQPIVVNIQTIK
ncbi:MAG: septal ring lytic transglycosylase RlpA family protein [Treponema sp.]|jgi:hypothetical protein|nr:septal ring lytic transglycosylase RlpA family protein [Treponema sp.]